MRAAFSPAFDNGCRALSFARQTLYDPPSFLRPCSPRAAFDAAPRVVTSCAVRLVHLLRLDADAHPVLSVGDAEVLHAFLQAGRREPPTSRGERAALAAVCRYLSSSGWMPLHLASEYRLRADVLERAEAYDEDEGERPMSTEPTGPVEARVVEAAVELSPPPPILEVEEEEFAPLAPAPEAATPDIEPEPPEDDTSPTPQPPPPNPVPRPEPPLPLPEPPGPGPEPEPEPEPEEAAAEGEALAEIEAMKGVLEKERADVESWARSRSEELLAKEEFLVGREKELASKEHQVEAE